MVSHENNSGNGYSQDVRLSLFPLLLLALCWPILRSVEFLTSEDCCEERASIRCVPIDFLLCGKDDWIAASMNSSSVFIWHGEQYPGISIAEMEKSNFFGICFDSLCSHWEFVSAH